MAFLKRNLDMTFVGIINLGKITGTCCGAHKPTHAEQHADVLPLYKSDAQPGSLLCDHCGLPIVSVAVK